MHANTRNKSLVALLRCTQTTSQGEVCGGTLNLKGDTWTCCLCDRQYQQVQGVPVLKAETFEPYDTWLEQIYSGRDRTLDLANDYLRSERELMGHFVREQNLHGPCLEIGCGTGLFAEIVPEFIGLDYSLNLLLARGFEPFTRVCGDARQIPLVDASVECIFSFNTLEHVPDLDLAFSEMDRVLKPAGFMVLKPAWHCTRYQTELIPILPYQQLNMRQKLTKALLPILTSKPYKFLTKVPYRLWRRITYRKNNSLSWRKLTPYHGKLWIADADATASIDSHEAILYYQSRRYQCLSHLGVFRQLLAGHDIVILRKP